jgi:hypothetical protein
MGTSHIFMSKQEIYEEKRTRHYNSLRNYLAVRDIECTFKEFERLDCVMHDHQINNYDFDCTNCLTVDDIIAEIEGV